MVCNEIGYAKIFAIYVEFRSEASSPASFWANTLHKRDFQKGTKNCFPFSNFSSFGVFFRSSMLDSHISRLCVSIATEMVLHFDSTTITATILLHYYY